jgi:hypothetical protein
VSSGKQSIVANAAPSSEAATVAVGFERCFSGMAFLKRSNAQKLRAL